MATLESQGICQITLPTGHVIPRDGVLTCTNDTIDANWPALQGAVIAGQVFVVRDPDPEETAPAVLAAPMGDESVASAETELPAEKPKPTKK